MTTRALAVVLALAVCCVWIASACLVDRKSDLLKCSGPSDCQSPRVCEGGFCVIDPNACPSECVSCDMNVTPHVCKLPSGTGGSRFNCPSGVSCEITCTSGQACGTINCQSGSQCTITCTGDGACNDVNCTGQNCNLMCNGPNACSDVTCSSGRCDVECSVDTSCNSVHCSNACACQLTCGTAAACGGIQCPRGMGNKYCTPSTNDGEPCITTATNCDKC